MNIKDEWDALLAGGVADDGTEQVQLLQDDMIESLLMGYQHRKTICLEEGGGFLGLVRHLGSGDERDAVVMVNKE